MKSRIFIALIFAPFMMESEVFGQCGNNFGMVNGESICMGYAMARASGLDYPTTWNADRIYSEYFTFHTGNDYLAGDIVILDSPTGDLSATTGHAAYIAQIIYPNMKDGLATVGSTGEWRDTDDHDPINDSYVICDQVNGLGASEQTGVTLAYIKTQRPSGQNTVRGYYRLKDEYKCMITFANSFGSGEINVGKMASGEWNNVASGMGIPLARKATLDAQAKSPQLDQSGAWQFFDKWKKGYFDHSFNIGMSITPVDGPVTYTADFGLDAPEGPMVSFENRAYGVSFGSIIKVNGQVKNSPTGSHQLSSGVTAEAYEVLDGFGARYTFINWSTGSASRYLTPTVAGAYYANYSAKPYSPINAVAAGPIGGNPVVTWTDNENGAVTYQIWRRLCPRIGPPYSGTYLGSVAHGVQSFTDYDIMITSYYSDYIVQYDIRSVYVLGGTTTYSDENYAASIFGTEFYKANDENDESFGKNVSAQLPTEYGVRNYPNPFNPSTAISYQLPEDASVQLEIYDMMGKRIAALVSDNKSAGYYSVVWSGKNESGTGVASGMYLYRFNASPVSGHKSFSRSGKLLLMK
jgi:hypothetical protein